MKNRKTALKDWLIVLLSFLDDAVVLIVIIIVLRYFKVNITLPVWIVIGVLFVGFVVLMHKAIVPTLHRSKVTGAEGMVGRAGKVVDPLTPSGTVHIGSELWKAQSVDGDIARGEDVEVVKVRELTLEVRRKKQVK